MEKLLNLLNEYRKEKGERNLNKFEVSQTLDSLNYLRLFIKWLVDNDKIDFHELSKKELATGWQLENNILDEEYTKENWIKYWTENLIMLLSIQDEPIEFLISVLK